MIIFHEGLPRSGKSYEAMVKHVLPALHKGRHVFAHIDGLDVERIAECAEMPIGAVKALLHDLSLDQLKEIWLHVTKDSLVIIDEAQDHWPSTRQPLGKELTTFVTQHGHEGLDILLMGQDHRDVHTLWRRRIQNLITFLKLDAVGMEQRYRCSVHRYNGRKFVPISSSIGSYEPKYFGMYKSHTDGTENKGNYIDRRAVVWNKPALRYGVPLILLAGIFAVRYLWGFFHQPIVQEKVKKPPEVSHVVAKDTVNKPVAWVDADGVERAIPPPSRQSAVEVQAALEATLEAETRYVLDLQKLGRLRLAAVIKKTYTGEIIGLVDVLDASFHRKESLRFSDLQALGWQTELAEYGVKLMREGQTLIVRPWPIDPVGYVPSERFASGDLRSKKESPDSAVVNKPL